jgi:ATP phosphoribosyltransferase
VNRLKIAVTKGRLLEDSLDLFEKMGFDCSAVRADTRKLILPILNYPMDVVLSKAADVLTYVSHGACDLGIVGKDTIMEHGGSFSELLDLGYGKCRFALAVPEGSDFYGTYRDRVVASKYPNVTKAYFAQKGMDVSVIKIEGSVELAPLVGLSSGIVDIVQTGTTLKENGLTPIETVAPVSARLIVNTASMKLYQKEIFDFIDKIEVAKA